MDHKLNLQTGQDVPRSVDSPARRSVRPFGIILRVVAVLLVLGGAAFAVISMFGAQPEGPARQPRERAFTVAVVEPQLGKFSPSIQAYGAVMAAREIDLRAEVSGPAIAVSPNLVVGGQVEQGEVLVRIDDFTYQGALRDAEAVLADATAQLAIAEEQLALEQVNADAAREQAAFARRDLERAKALLSTGSITDKTVEDRELLVSQRDQTVAQRESALRLQQAAINRQKTAITRAEWTRAQAARGLENTIVRAPFAGVVKTASTAKPGRLISSGEVLAQLYARDEFEVRFTISDQQYGQLRADGLIGRMVTAVWDIDPEPVRATGTIARVGAEVNAALGGVEMFALLEEASGLRPGIFVALEIAGRVFEDALRLPETALYENSHFYVVRAGRMARLSAEILARDGAHIIVRADIEAGDRVIATRVAQAGDGVKVLVEGEENTPENTQSPKNAAMSDGEQRPDDGEPRSDGEQRPGADGTRRGARAGANASSGENATAPAQRRNAQGGAEQPRANN